MGETEWEHRVSDYSALDKYGNLQINAIIYDSVDSLYLCSCVVSLWMCVLCVYLSHSICDDNSIVVIFLDRTFRCLWRED